VGGGLFLVGAGTMLVNVLLKVYAPPEGRLSLRLLKTLQALGMSPDPATIHGPVSLGLNLVICFLLCWAALRTMKRQPPISTPKAILIAAVGTAALAGLMKLLLIVLPNGLIWAPRAALASMLWIGLLGASTATYDKRHLALEMGDKIWPKPALRWVKALALLSAAALCIFLLILSVVSIEEHRARWLVNPVAEGENLSSELLLPKWVLLLVLPYTFLVMTVRLLAQAVCAARGQAEAEPAAEAAK
jgi:TRAP-type C4-dicarboxylate transport system permease small subunit